MKPGVSRAGDFFKHFFLKSISFLHMNIELKKLISNFFLNSINSNLKYSFLKLNILV